MDEERDEQSADLFIGHRTGVRTKPVEGRKVSEPVSHVERDVPRNRLWKLRLTATDLQDARPYKFRIDLAHSAHCRLTPVQRRGKPRASETRERRNPTVASGTFVRPRLCVLMCHSGHCPRD